MKSSLAALTPLSPFVGGERFANAGVEVSPSAADGVPELPAATARKIYAQLHKAGRA